MLKACTKCNQDFEAKTSDARMCFPCYKTLNSMREIQRDELVIDIDDSSEHGLRCVSATGIKLFQEGYHFELWYASGQKQPHIHIRNIPHLSDLTNKQLRIYKRMFLEKFIPREFWNIKIPDYSLCETSHLIAEEDKPHFKYKTVKLLRSTFNKEKDNFCDKELYHSANEIEELPKKEFFNKGKDLTSKIAHLVDIRDMAIQFGLYLDGHKALCPFHPDCKTPSLMFYPEKGSFFCFGCREGGSIIKFYALLKRLNPNFRFKPVVKVAVTHE